MQQYLSMLDSIDKMMKSIRASLSTADVKKANAFRNKMFRGLKAAVKAYTDHYDGATVLAASKLMIVFRQFGNIARMSQSNKTVSIRSLVAKLNADFVAEMALLNITQWVAKLNESNSVFVGHRSARINEKTLKPKREIKKSRFLLDRYYRAIIKLINARILIGDPAPYTDFVNKMNTIVHSYKMVLAIRKGRHAAEEGE